MERLVAWYRVTSSVGAVVTLVVANAIPLIGVLFFGWSVWTILIIYWLENGVVGFFNVLKMLKAEGGEDPATTQPARTVGTTAWRINSRAGRSMAKVALVPFFIVHYGLFWLVHGVFVLTLPLFANIGQAVVDDSGFGVPTLKTPSPSLDGIAFAVVVLFISHGTSYLLNYVRGGEYRTATPIALMFAPYGRLVILHVTIIFGAVAISFTGAPVIAVAILVLLKTVMDLGFHLRQHRGVIGPLATAA